ncbi:ParB/RepB/Spo0J family partition protein [Nocardioides panaciterrulae]|uniref:ParB family chromosome partitioning protein n=1 Tax=Nocardioides panaciterrulae TaxID=661492 RepID=A0A7Y9E307_9ACTN|nr:ParB/RepB/Spo0J family partition protein [Nocardioides panaciterrulae]NYD39991.1 ParB family chromosome partitioning protein [Nocardioides panaciterrulae]
MNASRPPQRRGLGRGLGSLIPTAPAQPAPADRDSASGAPSPEPSPAGADAAARPEAGAEERTDGRTDGNVSGAVQAAPAAGPVGSDGLAPVAGAYFAEIPVGLVAPNRAQPRQVFDEDAMAELVHSIREVGLLQPIVVRRTGGEAYELVMGERRWRAATEAGLETIPAIVRETDDTAMLRDALLENLHRSQLNPLEEAAAYQQLLEDFGCTHDELAGRIGRSRPQISNTLRLLRLSPAVQRRVAAGVLSAGHARALLGVEDPDRQDRLAQRVVAEGISVRALEEIVAIGEADGPAPRAPRRKPSAPGLVDIADRLSDRFETRVKVDLGKAKGKITVEFATLDDLQRIVDVMDPRNRTDRVI